jgi:hypothetical protein
VIGPDFASMARAQAPRVRHDDLLKRLGVPEDAGNVERLVAVVSGYMSVALGLLDWPKDDPRGDDNPVRPLVEGVARERLRERVTDGKLATFTEELAIRMGREFYGRIDEECRNELVRFLVARRDDKLCEKSDGLGTRGLSHPGSVREAIADRVYAAVGGAVHYYWPKGEQ